MVVPHTAWDRYCRPLSVSTFPAGNGINAARAASLFGVPVRVLGFVGDADATVFAQVGSPDITVDLTPVPGETRVNTIMIDGTGGETHMTGNGYAVRPSDVEQLVAKLSQVQPGEWVVLTGSLPPGMDARFYADMIRLLHKLGARVVLDARTPELAAALPEQPDMIKPNWLEYAALVGGDPTGTDAELLCFARRRLPHGIVVVSLGRAGIFAHDAEDGRAWLMRCDPSGLEVQKRVGCGDCFIGWFVAARACHDVPTSLKYGVAAATANLTTPMPGSFPASLAHRYVDEGEIEVRRVA